MKLFRNGSSQAVTWQNSADRQIFLSTHSNNWKYKLASSKNSEPEPQDLVKISEPAKLVPVKVAKEVAELPEISQAKPKKSSDIYIQIGHKSSLIIPDNFKKFQNRNSCQNTWSAAEFMIFEGNTRRIHLISVKGKLSGILL